MKDLSLENGCVKKVFFKFAIPSVVGLLIVSMQIMIDGMFIGNIVGPRGLAAVNLAMPYMSTIMSIVMMISAGGAVLASISLGKNQKQRAGEIATFTLVSYLVIIGVISIGSLFFLDKIILFLGADRGLLPLVKAYMKPLLLLCIFLNLPIYTETFARVGEKPNSVFLSGLVCFFTNVALDYLFIVRFGWGMSGAAYATAIANLLGGLALFGYFFNGRSQIQFFKLRGDFKLLKNILYNGSSEMLTMVSTSVAAFLFNKIIMKELGELGVSALTIVFYVNTIVNISLYGLAQALQPIISYNLGAKRIGEIYDVLKVSLITGGSIGIVFFILMKFFSAPIVNMFANGNNELILLTNEAIAYFVFAYIFSFINIISSSFHTAIEKPLESASIACFRSLIFVGIFLFILPSIFGAKGIWMAVPMAEVACLIISIFMMKRSFRAIEYTMKLAPIN
ncbi:MATE family efflux transporter [Psychrilyobacter sp.]|uniref:MATE family efflux transporter n=1 Tax=Psychrilyobacter sp. TaxID=2586924 RepID=UPI00301739A4